MSGRETYDVSRVERKILEEKAKRRAILRHEYLKQIENPFRQALGTGGTVDDPSVNRFMAMRAAGAEYFKPTWKNGLWQLGWVVAPIVIVTYVVYKSREAKEHSYRTGQVSYRDRPEKFI
ncbi:hypothetical protein HCN44_004605 [Aphidius gifuensis]|uniref:NADH dehydrogenase [ubiquinone] 1 beta subcomplex subunit 4 n=1 Tax=Aphidius gifuensis TaxID=684658 RepID=A0A835CV92_APHGI|nr:uncharacterized protein LOC122848930 [Aphidius gifuensis]KAF7995133.1 hypothetical protein HCN44_004605 [Aphidius gifuensis]